MYKSYINAEMPILMILLEKGEEVTFKKTLQGYGLKDSDFDNDEYPDCSRRKFGYWKKSLLKRKLIYKLHTKGRREKYYSITPLGICYLCNFLQTLDKIHARWILKNLKIFYESKPFGKSWVFDMGVEFNFSKCWEKLEEVILEEWINDLKEVCSYITIKPENEDFVVSMSYLLDNQTSITMGRYRIFNDKTVKELHDKIKKSQIKDPKVYSSFTDIYSEVPYPGRKSDRFNEIAPYSFYYWISMFILYAIHFKLVKKHFDKFNKKLTEELEEKGMAKKRKLKQIYGEINKIGLYEYNVIEVARKFANNLNYLLDDKRLELEQFENILNTYESGEIPEAPLSIKTASKTPVIRSKKLRVNLSD